MEREGRQRSELSRHRVRLTLHTHRAEVRRWGSGGVFSPTAQSRGEGEHMVRVLMDEVVRTDYGRLDL